MKTIRIHGDNIVECERVLKFLSPYAVLSDKNIAFLSASVVQVTCSVTTPLQSEIVQFQMFPGFNKANRKRWQSDVFAPLRKAGSYLDETPDAIITSYDADQNTETILCAIEFSSALQAGNQAWQRSGRAYSFMRAGCPYIYVLDFVKYELDAKTRVRKALRMPNPVVPFSYVMSSKRFDKFAVQVFTQAEEFNPADNALSQFDTTVFSEELFSRYLINLIFDLPTQLIEQELIDKNEKMVTFFSSSNSGGRQFAAKDWQDIYLGNQDLETMVETKKLPWRKKIAQKSIGQNSKANKIAELCSRYAYGVGATDLPFGYIPKAKVREFVYALCSNYPELRNQLNNELNLDRGLVVCLIKGFKPRGDDNRPDRGILPLAAMLFGEQTQVLTYIYGPVSAHVFAQLKKDPKVIAARNGLWRSLLSLSNLLLIDSPSPRNQSDYSWGFVGSSEVKQILLPTPNPSALTFNAIPVTPNSCHEDDVDTVVHFLFSAIAPSEFFEGLCNPPGGDWSGLSVVVNGNESRWLSLPRVSGDIRGKRPDHLLELFPASANSIFLSVESKERAQDLEKNVGSGLKEYLRYLFGFAPSAYRPVSGSWQIARDKVQINPVQVVSVAAYLGHDTNHQQLLKRTQCEMAIEMIYEDGKWKVDISNLCLDAAKFARVQKALSGACLPGQVSLSFS